MRRHQFSSRQRYAVFTAHGERCWLCSEPLSLSEMDVDHVLPESLIGSPALSRILSDYGLAPTFDLNSPANWLPSHRKCNTAKSGRPFKPTPIIQEYLRRAAEKADRVQALITAQINNRDVDRAISRLLTAHEEGTLPPAQITLIESGLMAFHEFQRDKQLVGTPLLLAPGFSIVGQDASTIFLRGPTGMVGGRPVGPHVHTSWDCPYCGFTAWNGARCIRCGMLDDGD